MRSVLLRRRFAIATFVTAGFIVLALPSGPVAASTSSTTTAPAPASTSTVPTPVTSSSNDTLPPPTSASSTSITAPSPYYLALGDSLAYGAQPNGVPATDGYVYDVENDEASSYPGLTLQNLGCSGETTTTFLNGKRCGFAAGSQLAAAEAFLDTHRGQVAFITIDIGANDVDGCLGSKGVDLACAVDGIATIKQNLPVILSGLEDAAGPDVPIVALNYYDPYLSLWLQGSTGQSEAGLSLAFMPVLNGTLDDIYGSFNVHIADVASAFATAEIGQDRSYQGSSVPLDVYNVCEWTWMCTADNIHANDAGYTVLAKTVDSVVSRLGHAPGLWLVSADGGVVTVGAAPYLGSAVPLHPVAPVVGIAATPDGGGYWLASRDGGVFSFGDAQFFGSAVPLHPVAPVVGIAATPDGGGYWLASRDGGVFSFGDAQFFGSDAGGLFFGSIVSIASTSDGFGYWLTWSTGGFSNFGDAISLGSTQASAITTAGSIVALVPTPDADGYWMVSSRGGVYPFGAASSVEASLPGVQLPHPVVAAIAAPEQSGYWLVDSSGVVLNVGGASHFLDATGLPLTSPIVAAARR